MLLPPQLVSSFRGLIARCVHRRARSRPTVKELQAWSRGAQLLASLSASGSHPIIPEATASARGTLEVRDEPEPEEPAVMLASATVMLSSADRRWMMLVLAGILGAIALFGLGWAAIR